MQKYRMEKIAQKQGVHQSTFCYKDEKIRNISKNYR